MKLNIAWYDNCQSPDFQILPSPTRNLDRLYICLVVRCWLYAEILQIPPDLPVQQNFPSIPRTTKTFTDSEPLKK